MDGGLDCFTLTFSTMLLLCYLGMKSDFANTGNFIRSKLGGRCHILLMVVHPRHYSSNRLTPALLRSHEGTELLDLCSNQPLAYAGREKV